MKITIQIIGEDITVGIERTPCVSLPAPAQAAPIAEPEPGAARASVEDGWEWMRSLDWGE